MEGRVERLVEDLRRRNEAPEGVDKVEQALDRSRPVSFPSNAQSIVASLPTFPPASSGGMKRVKMVRSG